MCKNLKEKLKELTEEALELTDFGNSKEKERGRGMLKVLHSVESWLETLKTRKENGNENN